YALTFTLFPYTTLFRSHNMGKAILLSGDGDFKPLVESVVQLGVFVEVSADPRHTSSELTWVADDYRPITLQNYFDMTSNILRQRSEEHTSELQSPYDLV